VSAEKGQSDEPAAVVERYARRSGAVDARRYDPLSPSVYMTTQERQRALIRAISRAKLAPLRSRTAFEVGCGSGGNLAELIRLGFEPENLVGNELQPERLAAARALLPAGVRLLPGDANELDLPEGSFDVVVQSTVFSSLLDPRFQEQLASRLWGWVKPGGGVLWYDFTWDNPRNPDVKGVPADRIRELFPRGRLRSRRVTLAPPISRLVTRLHPSLYTAFSALPFLRTHLLCWIAKA